MVLSVTAGKSYADIDVLACVIAYAELRNAIPVILGLFNAAIRDIVKN